MSLIVVFVNGKARQLYPGISLSGLVETLKLKPSMVLIELNGRALHRHEWEGVSLAHGDRVEILRVVAGG